MATTRTEPDRLTVAFMAIGAAEYLRENPEVSKQEGRLELIDNVVLRALSLDRVADWFDVRDGHPGVWVYDVAEEFGRAFTAKRVTARKCLHSVMLKAGYAHNDIEEAIKEALNVQAL